MINGIIKLFYSEVVKTKMKGMSSSDYKIRDEYKEIKNISLKIDSMFFKCLKFIMGSIILILSFNINVIFGIGTFLVEVAYIVYKKMLEQQVKMSIDTLKNNINSIELPKVNGVTERSKSQINILITLLVIGLLTSFNWSVVISFIVVFIFTIKDIYSNIK
ncbi:hypothetical protein [Clostridium sp. CCUG 7971]|uniref:hypothetical protein n=1 Tax=Clostridium sp. CCUG 7971 TaxID=2811414 RepID=UPI001ABB6DD5|nr:hypothetical protein [Clostridium sp. CCUG 7971]MBO3443329.1 hypothetical protein [Clostridium sp. CCUG 7971]